MVGNGIWIEWLGAARRKSRAGDRESTRCMWVSHYGRAARKGCKAEWHMWIFACFESQLNLPVARGPGGG